MSNRTRSALTVLGVAVGVAVVMAIAALITGVRSSVMEAFESAGPNNFMVTRFDFTAVRLTSDGSGRPPWWNTPEIEPEEARTLGTLPSIDEALYNFSFNASVSFEGHRVEGVPSQAYSSGWPRYQPGDFVAGRDFTPTEVNQNRPVVVLSVDLARELFGQRNPIGRFVRVSAGSGQHQESFAVLGVFEAAENIFTAATPYWAVFPWTAANRRLRQSRWQAQVLVVPNDSVGMSPAQDEVITSLRSMRGLGPREENDFALLASAQVLDLFNRLTGVFFLVILLLASAGLLVGGIGVIGIMLISVTERTREIGIRKAVGATRGAILWQFLAEASLLTLAGASVGMVGGWALAATVATWTPIPAAVPIWAVAASLAMAVVTGMLFGLLPAYRASRLNPVDALRFE
ncbi:MAG: ABC transporter permease [Gemmatimonadota bacterium]|nr:ABC transporter permease [Gemmatimonadota bacterium]